MPNAPSLQPSVASAEEREGGHTAFSIPHTHAHTCTCPILVPGSLPVLLPGLKPGCEHTAQPRLLPTHPGQTSQDAAHDSLKCQRRDPPSGLRACCWSLCVGGRGRAGQVGRRGELGPAECLGRASSQSQVVPSRLVDIFSLLVAFQSNVGGGRPYSQKPAAPACPRPAAPSGCSPLTGRSTLCFCLPTTHGLPALRRLASASLCIKTGVLEKTLIINIQFQPIRAQGGVPHDTQ